MNIKDFVKAKEKINEQFKKGQITKEQRSNALKKLREARSAARAGRLSKTPIGQFINYLTGSKPLSSVVDKKAATTRAAVSNLGTKTTKQVNIKTAQAKRKATDAMSSKKKTPSAPPSRPTPPKRKSKNTTTKTTTKTSMSEGNTLAGSSGRKTNRNAPNFGLGKMSKKNAPNVGLGKMPKKKAPSKSKDKKDPRGNQIKAISSLPAGALRKFQGRYDNKKEKLRNVGGKTFVFKK